MADRNELFGTDGIRGRSGVFPLDPESLLKIGNTAAGVFAARRVLIARDTRESGTEIEEAFSRGLTGVRETVLAGVLPTPALACLTLRGGFDLGVMISASHNPWQDNGLKFFGPDGKKISRAAEGEFNAAFFSPGRGKTGPNLVSRSELSARYLEFLESALERKPLPSLKLVADCANGAVAAVIEQVFSHFGLNGEIINAAPNGRNINLDCGATQTKTLQAAVRARGADLGFAFDGDGDRLICVNSQGVALDGDHSLWILALDLVENEKRFNRQVVGTVMSNSGLETALQEKGMVLHRAAVGDREVMLEMKARQSILGGEPSGHTILGHRHTTGDGLLTALFILRALQGGGLSLDQAVASLQLRPLLSLDLPVEEKFSFSDWPPFQKLEQAFKAETGTSGRLLVRYSGTENKLRIMVEHPDQNTASCFLDRLRDLFNSRQGELR